MPPDHSTDPPTESRPFCGAFWYVAGYRHACLKRQGHDGSCWCCDDYPGGALASFATLLMKGHTINALGTRHA